MIGTTKMNDADNSVLLMATVVHDLVTDAEALLLIANALEDRASDVSSNADAQRLRPLSTTAGARLPCETSYSMTSGHGVPDKGMHTPYASSMIWPW